MKIVLIICGSYIYYIRRLYLFYIYRATGKASEAELSLLGVSSASVNSYGWLIT